MQQWFKARVTYVNKGEKPKGNWETVLPAVPGFSWIVNIPLHHLVYQRESQPAPHNSLLSQLPQTQSERIQTLSVSGMCTVHAHIHSYKTLSQSADSRHLVAAYNKTIEVSV